MGGDGAQEELGWRRFASFAGFKRSRGVLDDFALRHAFVRDNNERFQRFNDRNPLSNNLGGWTVFDLPPVLT
jgi:hypothetical protein